MKIRVASDLHTEFVPMGSTERVFEKMIPYLDDEQNMVLILAGDIVANFNDWHNSSLDVYTSWLYDLALRHKALIYVGGNHEGYFSGGLIKVLNYWHEISSTIPNFHFLENETVEIDGARFLGTTLWTALDNPINEIVVKDVMNDFNYIKGMSVAKWKYAHTQARAFLEDELAKEYDGDTVVVTHHAPSFMSVAECYAGNPCNDAYASNLDNLIAYNDIKLWCHGHTHVSFDYEIADTRIICNPHGYWEKEENPNYNPSLVVDL